MGRKNNRIRDDLYLSHIKEEEEYRPALRCWRFPSKTVFTTGYRAQVAIDEIRDRSDRERTPVRVYECFLEDNGCGYFHITSQEEYTDFNS